MLQVEWKEKTVKRPQLPRKVTVMPDGKRKTETVYDEVAIHYPAFSGAESFDDVALALVQIQGEGKPGFDTLETLTSYVVYGLQYGPTALLRKGQDFRYTPEQRSTIAEVASLVRKNLGLTREMGLEILQRQGVPDAAQALAVALGEADDDGDDDDKC